MTRFPRRVVLELQIPELASVGVTQVGELVLFNVTVGDGVLAREVKLPRTHWTGKEAHELERRIREGDVPVKRGT